MKQIKLVATEKPLADAWNVAFEGTGVTVVHGSIFGFPADAIVSPANSFGFMDGGIDHLITIVLGESVQYDLQHKIAMLHHGELLVGAYQCVKTGHAKWPWLISAPTMRVPMRLPSDTVNPYLAARAIFIALEQNDQINSVVVPGLGTGVGNVSPTTCAQQMRKAYDDVFCGYAYPRTWKDAQTRHQQLYTSAVRDLQQAA